MTPLPPPKPGRYVELNVGRRPTVTPDEILADYRRLEADRERAMAVLELSIPINVYEQAERELVHIRRQLRCRWAQLCLWPPTTMAAAS